MPPTSKLVPALLLVLALLLLLRLVLARRRGGAGLAYIAPPPESGAGSAREPAEVRALRLQVETLTEALRDATGSAAVPAAPVDPMAPSTPFTTELPADLATEAPVETPADTWLVPIARTEPVDTADRTAEDYTELSRSLAAAGRLREAALAQWAGDLRVLAPLVGHRAPELIDGVAALAPVDAATAVTAARAVAAGLVGPGVAVTDMLPDASHLADHADHTTDHPVRDLAPDVLPGPVADALRSVLVESAERCGDDDQVSVGLRTDLVAQVVSAAATSDTTADTAGTAAAAHVLARRVLEPHERTAFDALLAS